ncbi:exported hypothetical protein [Xanthomonas citri pv. fuscans]|nr:exported hypothetical protein [Xanthomonas citri pv. fuscans]SOO33252.1 exported hypothetical protein [Xanthomonas citri pv. fuscans]
MPHAVLAGGAGRLSVSVLSAGATELRAANKAPALTARRTRPPLGVACATRALLFLLAAHTHMATARYVLFVAPKVRCEPAACARLRGHAVVAGIRERACSSRPRAALQIGSPNTQC